MILSSLVQSFLELKTENRHMKVLQKMILQTQSIHIAHERIAPTSVEGFAPDSNPQKSLNLHQIQIQLHLFHYRNMRYERVAPNPPKSQLQNKAPKYHKIQLLQKHISQFPHQINYQDLQLKKQYQHLVRHQKYMIYWMQQREDSWFDKFSL